MNPLHATIDELAADGYTHVDEASLFHFFGDGVQIVTGCAWPLLHVYPVGVSGL